MMARRVIGEPPTSRVLKNDHRVAWVSERGVPPSAASEAACETSVKGRAVRRGRSEGERGYPALRHPATNGRRFSSSCLVHRLRCTPALVLELDGDVVDVEVARADVRH